MRFFGWYESVDFYFIAMEYAEHGDLNHHLMNATTKPGVELAKKLLLRFSKRLWFFIVKIYATGI